MSDKSLLLSILSTDFDVDYQAILDYAEANAIPLPGYDIQRLQSRLVARFKEIGFWDTQAALWVLAGDPNAREFATLNWKDPSTHRLTEHGTLTFSSLGFQGNGSTGYLNTHFNPSTNGAGLFVQNSASILVQMGAFNTMNAGVAFGLRNAAGTSQINALPISNSVGFENNTRFVLNDNTNHQFAGNPISRGLYFFDRVSAGTKTIWRKSVASGNLSVTSVSVPSGDLYLLARNSLSTATVDAFSDDIISLFSIGAPVDVTIKEFARNHWINYYLAVQKPLFRFRPADKRVVYQNSVSGWDEGSVFGSARYDTFEIYGGTTETGGATDNYDVGAFDYAGLVAGAKDAANPIFDTSSVGSISSIFPMDKFIVGSTIYWLVTVRTPGPPIVDAISLMSSPTSDPKNLTYIAKIVDDGGLGKLNHAAKYFENPFSATYHHIIYSHRNVTADAFRIRIRRCLKTDDITVAGNWTTLHDNVVAVPYVTTTDLGQVYADLYYDSVYSKWILLYGRFAGEQQSDSFTIFSTESTDLSAFPVGKETLWPTGSTGDPDKQYASFPRIDLVNKLLFYSGRIGGSAAPYTSRLVKSFQKNY